MENGIYGTVRPAKITPSRDVEIFYSYRPTRGTEDDNFANNTFYTLSSDCLVQCKITGSTSTALFGMYNLRLPIDQFSKKGIYTIYIRPKEIITTIIDKSSLVDYTDVKGIILNASVLDNMGETDLSGYRVEYYSNDEKIDPVRLITSCNYCSPVVINSNGTTQYKLTDATSSLLFCTLTPSSSNSFKPNTTPFIGNVGQQIALINTKFNPIMLEIEMVEHDEDTISYALEGTQVRDRDNAIMVTYNDEGEVYSQHDFYTLKNSLGESAYDVKRKKDTLTPGYDYNDIIGE